MKRNSILKLTVLIFLLFTLAISGVSAKWIYLSYPENVEKEISSTTTVFRYGTFYITEAKISDGSYESAEVSKTADLDISSTVKLNTDNKSSVLVEVTFYNNTDVSYFYSEAQTTSHNNNSITYTVSGMEKKEEVPAKSFKTIYITYAYAASNTSNSELLSSIHFSFVVDKESIGGVVAQTAVDRFRDILNNKVFEDSYDTLDNAMSNRSGFNKASAVTYIGNVSGSSNADSTVIKNLFGEEFMSMDLDGDGKSEPITLMIKRENLDGNSQTGDDYTYKNLIGISQNVYGAEMTIYITSEGFSSNTLTVYAATFTKLSGSDTWIEVVSLTKGTATANRYSIGFGSNNSFNTDTWKSDNKETMDTLVERAMTSLS